MQIQLIWTNAATGDRLQPLLETPVALGSDFDQMPTELDGRRVARIVLADNQISPYHALIQERNGELLVVDQNSNIGTEINGMRLPSSTLIDGDRLRLGACEIQVRITTSVGSSGDGGCDRMVGFLFKRRCGRTNTTDCSYCRGGRVTQDPSWDEYSYYGGYGRYDDWGSYYYSRRDYYYYNRETGNVDFTEADSEAFENEMDTDFEQDLGAS